jgi:hypothetical protein
MNPGKGKRLISLPKHLVSTLPSFSGYSRGCLPWGVKQLVCETSQLPSCGAKVMNEWSCTSTLHIYVFMACIESPLPSSAVRWSRIVAISILFMR